MPGCPWIIFGSGITDGRPGPAKYLFNDFFSGREIAAYQPGLLHNGQPCAVIMFQVGETSLFPEFLFKDFYQTIQLIIFNPGHVIGKILEGIKLYKADENTHQNDAGEQERKEKFCQ